MITQFFYGLYLTGLGLSFSGVCNLLLQQGMTIKDGKCNYRYLYLTHLLTLGIFFWQLPAFTLSSLIIFSVAGLGQLIGMIWGDQPPFFKNTTVVGINEALLFTAMITVTICKILACTSPIGFCSVVGYLIPLLPFAWNCVANFFNIKLNLSNSFLKNLKNIENKLTTWLSTYALFYQATVWLCIFWALKFIAQYHVGLSKMLDKVNRFIARITLVNSFYQAALNDHRGDHPYLYNTLAQFKNPVLPDNSQLKFKNNNILKNANDFLERFQTAGRVNANHNLYWNLPKFMDYETKRKIFNFNKTQSFTSVTREQFLESVRVAKNESPSTGLNVFQYLVLAEGEQNPTRAASLYHKAKIMVDFYTMDCVFAATPDRVQSLLSLFFLDDGIAIDNQLDVEREIYASSQWNQLIDQADFGISKRELASQDCAVNGVQAIMPIEPLVMIQKISRFIESRCDRHEAVEDQDGGEYKQKESSLELYDLLRKFSEHTKKWNQFYQKALIHDLTVAESLLCLMTSVLEQSTKALLCLKDLDVASLGQEQREQLINFMTRYNMTIGLIDFDSPDAPTCVPLMVQSFQTYVQQDEPVFFINRSMNEWAKQKLNPPTDQNENGVQAPIQNNQPVFLQSHHDIVYFLFNKPTWSNFFYKIGYTLSLPFNFLSRLLAFDTGLYHAILYRIEKFFGMAHVAYEYHRTSRQLCDNVGVLPFIVSEDQEHYAQTNGPSYLGDFKELSGLDISWIESSKDFNFIIDNIIDPYCINKVYGGIHPAIIDNYSKLEKIKKHFADILDNVQDNLASLEEEEKAFYSEVDQNNLTVEQTQHLTSRSKELDALARSCVILKLVKEDLLVIDHTHLQELLKTNVLEKVTADKDVRIQHYDLSEYKPKHDVPIKVSNILFSLSAPAVGLIVPKKKHDVV
jgi:hypothetical protein